MNKKYITQIYNTGGNGLCARRRVLEGASDAEAAITLLEVPTQCTALLRCYWRGHDHPWVKRHHGPSEGRQHAVIVLEVT